MKVKEPLNNRVLIKPVIDTVTESGIIIPGKKDEKPEIGLVIDCSHDCKINLKGKQIMFNKFTTVEIKHKDDIHLLVKYDDIYAILD